PVDLGRILEQGLNQRQNARVDEEMDRLDARHAADDAGGVGGDDRFERQLAAVADLVLKKLEEGAAVGGVQVGAAIHREVPPLHEIVVKRDAVQDLRTL